MNDINHVVANTYYYGKKIRTIGEQMQKHKTMI